MPRIFARPMGLACLLLMLTFIPIFAAGLRMYQVPTQQLPPDAIKFATVPWSLFMHALGGALFGLLGPVQFAGVLRHRFGWLHRMTGRVFVVAGLMLSLSSLRLVAAFPDASTWVLVSARVLAGLAVGGALIRALIAIRRHDIVGHRGWMIRAYAIGMGSATISFIMLPIFLITGRAVEGYGADMLFVASWATNIAIAEWVIRRGHRATVKPHRLGAVMAQSGRS
jgi:uncharacterized membrane protein